MTMRLIAVNVGQPRQVVWKGRPVTTGIFQEPVAGRVALRQHNLDGDAQADVSVHGGPSKAVDLYPAEHYVAWRQELPNLALPWGMCGENFTTAGILEATMQIGDRLRIGTAVVRVTKPRMPCYKLGFRKRRRTVSRASCDSERIVQLRVVLPSCLTWTVVPTASPGYPNWSNRSVATSCSGTTMSW